MFFMSRQARFVIYLMVAIALFGVRYCKNQQAVSSPQTAGFFVPDKQAKFSNCQVNGKYPDHACTPGVTIASATKDQICVSGYSKGVRNVPEQEKRDVYAEYGITHRTTGEYEVDHYISLELGGSNDIANLFPEASMPKPGFHEKDKVENYLHEQVCSGAISLNEAQREIDTGWYEVYVKIQ
jgi:hypothetical protein